MKNNAAEFDVAIVGGGPAGSTCAGLLRKYRPNIKVGIFEREHFPRDHVGESQLPLISKILNELGVWDKVEAANFPIKIGATYRWGNSDDLWDFNFIAGGEFVDMPRPGKFEGQRLETAFQVDRGIYDKILLDHARDLGAEIYEGCAVREVLRNGDRITGLKLDTGEEVSANYFVDASGQTGFLRRAMGVGVEEPSNLKNIAIWDYWNSAEWAVNLGIGGTRVQVMSISYGWLWFIPLGPDRTSIGFVCPADYFKQAGLKAEELYLRAISEEPRIAALVENATREKLLSTTKDWSFLAERTAGENWFLTGESAGFADPVLAAGMSLAHASAREAAFTILAMGQGRDPWLREQYDERSRRKILQHIRFADYWYTANGHFTDLKEFTREIATDAGLSLDAESAFRWLGTGGFVEDDMGLGGLALFSLDCLHLISGKLSDTPSVNSIDGFSGFMLNLKGAETIQVAYYDLGQVISIPAYRRHGKILPLSGFFGWVVAGLQHSPSVELAIKFIRSKLAELGIQYDHTTNSRVMQTLEAMARDGWVRGKLFSDGLILDLKVEENNMFIGLNRDEDLPADRQSPQLRKGHSRPADPIKS